MCLYFCLGSEEGSGQEDQGQQQEQHKGSGPEQQEQRQPTVHQEEKGFLQKLKEVFWKPEDKEPEVEEIRKDRQKIS